MIRTPWILLALIALPFHQSLDCGAGDGDTEVTVTPDPNTPPPGACQSDEDCTGGQYCLNPGEPAPCGICYMPDETCYDNSTCPTGSVCAPLEASCLCYQTSVCTVSCLTAGCPDGQQCGADGLCTAISCTTGQVSCPPLTSCTAGADGDGCVRWTCTANSDCGSGNACVEGQCFETYGSCIYPSA